jgi:hypothetical protein
MRAAWVAMMLLVTAGDAVATEHVVRGHVTNCGTPRT